MGKIVAIANQKGGVGKTTTCVNLAASLAVTRRSVLLVDLDPQGNATMGCGVDKDALERSVCDVLLEGVAAAEVIQPALHENLALLPSNQELTLAEAELLNQPQREYTGTGPTTGSGPLRLHPRGLSAVSEHTDR